MYPWLLFLHSWLRWLVVVAGIFTLVVEIISLVSKQAPKPLDRIRRAIYTGLFDLQVLIGLILYFGISPTVQSIWKYEGKWMKEPALRFWGMEHIAMMILALIVLRVGMAMGKRSSLPESTRRWSLGATAVSLLLVAAAIPWPWLAHGRPFFRGL